MQLLSDHVVKPSNTWHYALKLGGTEKEDKREKQVIERVLKRLLISSEAVVETLFG